MNGAGADGSTGWTRQLTEGGPAPAGPVLAEDVVLEASALRAPLRGREQVGTVMRAAAASYARLDFTHEATNGPRTYLEWEATAADGTELAGVTVLTRNPAGEIAHVAIRHRPLDGLLEFSRELGRRTAREASSTTGRRDGPRAHGTSARPAPTPARRPR